MSLPTIQQNNSHCVRDQHQAYSEFCIGEVKLAQEHEDIEVSPNTHQSEIRYTLVLLPEGVNEQRELQGCARRVGLKTELLI